MTPDELTAVLELATEAQREELDVIIGGTSARSGLFTMTCLQKLWLLTRRRSRIS